MSMPEPVEQVKNGRSREIIAILVMAFAVLLLVSLYSNASGSVGIVLSSWLRRLFGLGAVAPALFLLFVGFSLLRQRKPEGRARKLASVTLLFIVLLCAIHTVATYLKGPLTPYWAHQTGIDAEGGGALGAFLTVHMLTAFGAWGSVVVMVALAAIAVSLFMETSLTKAVRTLTTGVSAMMSRITGGGANFFTGLVQELRQLIGMWKDKRERAAAQRASRAAQKQKKSAANRTPTSRSRRERVTKPTATNETATPMGARGLAALLNEPAAPIPTDTSHSGSSHESDGANPESFDTAAELAPEPDVDASPAPTSRGTTRARNKSATSGNAKKAGGPDTIEVAGTDSEQQTVYTLPPTALLHRPKDSGRSKKAADEDQGSLLEETLANFGVQAKLVQASRGPVVTRYELQPAPGVKVSRIVNLADDVALSLAAADVRIEAPVPGRSVVGIEVPNKETTPVYLREVLDTPEFQDDASKLTVALGKDIAGNPVVADLTKLLHVLIAGATGSGKSVCINSIICSILYKAKPNEVKLLMIDPKRVELAVYDGIPHLITPVVTDPKMAANALRWAVKEMESRYKKFSEVRARNINGYNQQVAEGKIDDEPMPYLVVIVDELADLMLVAGNEVEDSICRLAQMARAAGIHLIIATQRPSVDVITGLIKANVPSRIAFAVSSGVDSRTILDMVGAERLIGKGDMLYYPIGANKPLRAQGAWIFDKEVQATVDFWKQQGDPTYVEDVTEVPKAQGTIEDGEDELFEDAVQLVVETGNASISMLQRRFRIGYARAARLIDMMELQGIVGPYQGSKPREVLRSLDTHDIAN